MSPSYLLGTNILSDLVGQPQGKVATRIAKVGEDAICTSIIVAAEFRSVAERSGSKQLAERVDLILSALEILSLEPPVERYFGELRQHLTLRGTPIDTYDLLIAAHALANGLTLVTANSREFKRVPDLHVENWLIA